MSRAPRASSALALALISAACAGPPGREVDEAPAQSTASTTSTPLVDERFVALLEDSLAAHRRWGRVDDRARFAPFDCRAPPPPRAHYSEAEGQDAHAGKLFTVYALDPAAYGFPASFVYGGVDESRAATERLRAAGVTQVLVKDAFVARPEAPDAEGAEAHLMGITRGETTYHPGARIGYFVLAKLDADTPGTDEGWVYGTLDASGAISSAGRVPTCMSCHQERPSRVFGLAGHPLPDAPTALAPEGRSTPEPGAPE